MKECAQSKNDRFHNYSTAVMGIAVAIMPSRMLGTEVTQYMYAIARRQMHSQSFAGKAVRFTKLSTNTSVTKLSSHCFLCCAALVFNHWYWQQCRANTHAFEKSTKIKNSRGGEKHSSNRIHRKVIRTCISHCKQLAHLSRHSDLLKQTENLVVTFTCALSSNLSGT